MQGLSRKDQLSRQLIRPAVTKEGQVGRVVAAIDFISNNPVSCGFQMHPDLMGASGPGEASNLRIPPECPFPPALDFETSDTFSPLGVDGLPDPNVTPGEFSFSSQAALNLKFLPLRPAVNDGLVFLADPTAGHFLPETPRQNFCSCDKNTSACFPIQAIHKVDLVAAKLDPQEIPQGHLIGSSGGMNDQRSWLIHHQPSGFLPQNLEIGP